MDNASLDDLRLIDVVELSRITGLSPATLWRHDAAGLLPRSAKIGRARRWRLRTGDPSTGVLDWFEAGCPPRRDADGAADTCPEEQANA